MTNGQAQQWPRKTVGTHFNSVAVMFYLRCPGRLSFFRTLFALWVCLGTTDPERYLQVAAVKTACNPRQTYQAIQGGRKDKLDAQSTELNSLIHIAKGNPAHMWYLNLTDILVQKREILLHVTSMMSFAFCTNFLILPQRGTGRAKCCSALFIICLY